MIGSSPAVRSRLTRFLLVLTPSVASAQAPDISVTATADKKTIELSQSLTVTLTVEGPAPLRVELPKQLLVPETERDWKIQATGPATVTQRWGIVSGGSSVFGSIPLTSASRWRSSSRRFR